MAENKFYLRPSADISVGHTLYPAESTSAYSLINEEASDGATTYISVSTGTGSTNPVSATSSFQMSGVLPSEKFRVSSARIICEKVMQVFGSGTDTHNFVVRVNGDAISITGEPFSGDFGETLFVGGGVAAVFPDSAIEIINNYIDTNGEHILPDISVELTTTVVNESADSKNSYNCQITKMYIELTYNLLIYRKVNSDWKGTYSVYEKINGIWTKFENGEGYNIVGSKLSRKGHHQMYLPRIESTCIDTGVTEGYKCEICGEIFVPQTTIPATGHSYVQSGGHNVCATCSYVEGVGFTELVSNGTATALSQARYGLAATTVGNYALFGGGSLSGSYLSAVEAYNQSLTRTIPTALSQERYSLAATTVGNYALFGGGYFVRTAGTSLESAVVDAYNLSLTRTIPTALSQEKHSLTATTVGNYALFGGGYSFDSYDTVDAYDQSLTRTTPSVLSQRRCDFAATTVGNYALFGGGRRDLSNTTTCNTVDAYDQSLTRTIPTALSSVRYNLAATTVGNYALFGGGHTGSLPTSSVDVYDQSLTKTSTSLNESINNPTATTVGNYALFGGGVVMGSNTIGAATNNICIYDMHLVRTTDIVLSQARHDFAATTVGNYALFGGGYDSNSNYYDTVDAYKLQAI